MRNHKLLFGLLLSLCIFSDLKVNAQLTDILQKAKDKVSKSSRIKKVTNVSTDFIPGDSLIFAENFSSGNTGTKAAGFKTNGAATVTTVEGQSGKWMILQDKSIYKLSRQITYPKHFTVEFDLLTSADQVKDVAPLSFGFAKDNSAREYTSNTGAYVELHYYDGDQVNIGNSNLNKYANTTFDLSSVLNRPLHVSLIVEDERMAVYLDKVKLADTDLFSPTDAKNFYITAPWQYENGSRVLISNLRIAAFKKE
jgi:hypothetical protein